ncbi:hypothetical protein PS947_05792 [Pseudomonas fluorescens]|nr:hypothetical protein PS947_05792 [Pseudomonas fluorescens]
MNILRTWPSAKDLSKGISRRTWASVGSSAPESSSSMIGAASRWISPMARMNWLFDFRSLEPSAFFRRYDKVICDLANCRSTALGALISIMLGTLVNAAPSTSRSIGAPSTGVPLILMNGMSPISKLVVSVAIICTVPSASPSWSTSSTLFSVSLSNGAISRVASTATTTRCSGLQSSERLKTLSYTSNTTATPGNSASPASVMSFSSIFTMIGALPSACS